MTVSVDPGLIDFASAVIVRPFRLELRRLWYSPDFCSFVVSLCPLSPKRFRLRSFCSFLVVFQTGCIFTSTARRFSGVLAKSWSSSPVVSAILFTSRVGSFMIFGKETQGWRICPWCLNTNHTAGARAGLEIDIARTSCQNKSCLLYVSPHISTLRLIGSPRGFDNIFPTI